MSAGQAEARPTGAPDRYCARCATPLLPNRGPTGQPGCPACGFTLYANPKVATGVVAARDGKILLIRRDHEPRMGEWSFPSGFVDAGEPVEVAAIREAWEETGLRVRPERLLGVFSTLGDPVIFVAYAAQIGAGEPVARDEVQEVGFFAPDAMPPLAFPHDPAIMAAWHAGTGITVTAPETDPADTEPPDTDLADNDPAGTTGATR